MTTTQGTAKVKTSEPTLKGRRRAHQEGRPHQVGAPQEIGAVRSRLRTRCTGRAGQSSISILPPGCYACSPMTLAVAAPRPWSILVNELAGAQEPVRQAGLARATVTVAG